MFPTETKASEIGVDTLVIKVHVCQMEVTAAGTAVKCGAMRILFPLDDGRIRVANNTVRILLWVETLMTPDAVEVFYWRELGAREEHAQRNDGFRVALAQALAQYVDHLLRLHVVE